MATSMNDYLVDETSSENESGTGPSNENDVFTFEEYSKTEDVANEFSVKTWKEDLTLSVEGRQLYVSSAVLALSSPVLSSKLEAVFKAEGPRILELPCRFDDFVEFLRCIYPSIKEAVTEKNALKVVKLAHEYKVESVEEACVDVLTGMVVGGPSMDTLSSILKVASSCQMATLKQVCIHEIIKNSGSTLESTMAKLHISSDDMLEIREAQTTSLKNHIHTLSKRLQEKSNRCNAFEHLIKSVWLKDLEIVNSKGVELHVVNLNVSNAEDVTEETIKARNIKWIIKAELKKQRYSGDISVVVLASGDQSWKQWTCKFKVSCWASDGDITHTSEKSTSIGSSCSRVSVVMGYISSDKLKYWKVTVVFAAGDILI